jgi:hypothetical protein
MVLFAVLCVVEQTQFVLHLLDKRFISAEDFIYYHMATGDTN